MPLRRFFVESKSFEAKVLVKKNGITFYYGIKPPPNDLQKVPYLGGGFYFVFEIILPPAAGGGRPPDPPYNVLCKNTFPTIVYESKPTNIFLCINILY